MTSTCRGVRCGGGASIGSTGAGLEPVDVLRGCAFGILSEVPGKCPPGVTPTQKGRGRPVDDPAGGVLAPRLHAVGRQPEVRDGLRDVRATELLVELQTLERRHGDA